MTFRETSSRVNENIDLGPQEILAAPEQDREVTAWAYKMDALPTPATPPAAVTPQKPKTPEEKAAAETAAAIANDTSPYVAIAVRCTTVRSNAAASRALV